MAQYIVCYDISHPNRLHRAAKILQGHALRLQRSVYLLETSPSQMQRCWQQLITCIDLQKDDLRCYSIRQLHSLECFGAPLLHDSLVWSGMDME